MAARQRGPPATRLLSGLAGKDGEDGAAVEISPRKASLWFWCCFFVTINGRVEGKLREEMDDGEGNLFDFGGERSGSMEASL